MQISVKADVASVKAQLHYLQNEAVTQAAARALNRTATQVQSAAVKEISARTGLKQKDVRLVLRVVVRATRWRLTSLVQATGKTLNIIRMQARKTGAGIAYKAWGKSLVKRRAFIGNRGRTVFQRVAGQYMPSRRGKTKHSEAIAPVHGPNIPRSMASAAVQAAMRKVVDERWPVNFESDLRYYLRK
jgi:hypothetical protein